MRPENQAPGSCKRVASTLNDLIGIQQPGHAPGSRVQCLVPNAGARNKKKQLGVPFWVFLPWLCRLLVRRRSVPILSRRLLAQREEMNDFLLCACHPGLLSAQAFTAVKRHAKRETKLDPPRFQDPLYPGSPTVNKPRAVI